MMKYLVALLVISALGAGIYIYTAGSPASEAVMEEDTNTVSGMLAEENAVVVMEQKPGNTVLGSMVYLAAPGFLVIHEDTNGQPGAILGASTLLQAGESSNITVSLSRATQDGERLHAMLHADTDGNGTFSASDVPVQSRLGGPLEGWFEITSSASLEPAPASI